MKISGTGSRSFALLPQEEEARILDDLVNEMRNIKAVYKDIIVVSGGAEGWDYELTIAAQLLDIPYELILPNRSYLTYYWEKHSVLGIDNSVNAKRMYKNAYNVKYTSDKYNKNTELFYVNHVPINLVRNIQMVEESDVFCVYGPTSRGTSQCLRVIKKLNKPWKEFK